MGMIAGDLGVIIVAVIVFRRCSFSELGLEIGNGELGVVAPVTGGQGPGFGEDEILQGFVRLAAIRHIQVAGKGVIQRGDVGGALDRGVAAQGEDAAAGPPDVAEQQLQDGGGADDLHADRVLRPADGIGDVRCPVAAGVVQAGSRPPSGTSPSGSRRSSPPSRACSGSSAVPGSGRRCAGSEASGPSWGAPGFAAAGGR